MRRFFIIAAAALTSCGPATVQKPKDQSWDTIVERVSDQDIPHHVRLSDEQALRLLEKINLGRHLPPSGEIARAANNKTMHYKNGRRAQVGDPIIFKDYNGLPKAGVVVKANAQSETCNLTVAPVHETYTVTAKEALHADDVSAADIPDSTVPKSAPPEVPAETK